MDMTLQRVFCAGSAALVFATVVPPYYQPSHFPVSSDINVTALNISVGSTMTASADILVTDSQGMPMDVVGADAFHFDSTRPAQYPWG